MNSIRANVPKTKYNTFTMCCTSKKYTFSIRSVPTCLVFMLRFFLSSIISIILYFCTIFSSFGIILIIIFVCGFEIKTAERVENYSFQWSECLFRVDSTACSNAWHQLTVAVGVVRCRLGEGRPWLKSSDRRRQVIQYTTDNDSKTAQMSMRMEMEMACGGDEDGVVWSREKKVNTRMFKFLISISYLQSSKLFKFWLKLNFLSALLLYYAYGKK